MSERLRLRAMREGAGSDGAAISGRVPPAGRRVIRTARSTRTRATILLAARRLFASQSYDEVSLRQIGAEARADPALVARYFGDKERLFREALAMTVELDQPIGSDPAAFSRRMARAAVLGEWREAAFEGLLIGLRSASVPKVASEVIDPLRHEFLNRLASSLKGEGASVRAEIVLAFIVGMALLHGMKPLGGASRPTNLDRAIAARFAQDLREMMTR